MTYPKFETRWKPVGGIERVNYDLFSVDLFRFIAVLESITDSHTQDGCVPERVVKN